MISNIPLIEAIAKLSPSMQEEVSRFVQYLQERQKQELPSSPMLDLPDYNLPIGVDAHRVEEPVLIELSALWDEEENAEELCKLLTA